MTQALSFDPAERRSLIEQSVRVWTGELVDLGGRNTLLYYKDLKQGTLDIGPNSATRSAAVDELLSSKSVRLSQLFTDEALVGAARRARTVRAKASENFEERGLQTLFLAWGMATWTSNSSSSTPAAPVLLRQASLTPRGSAGEDFDVSLPGEWEPNPTLLHLLRTEFGVALEAESLLSILDEDVEPPDASRLFELLTKTAVDVPGIGIAPRVVLGNFSYAKLPMVLDLETATDALTASELISALAGDVTARETVRARHPNVSPSLPDTVPPQDEFLVLDADASQSYAINAALGGAGLVVDGPPGTGKSQSIANLIASLSARGKRILFVAEKRAAIDAVVNRLRKVGLGELVLDLHEGAASKRGLYADLGRTMASASTLPRPDVSEIQDALVRRRRTLVERDEALHRSREPWAVSVYDTYTRIPGVPEEVRSSFRLRDEQLHDVDEATYRQARADLERFISLGALQLTRRVSTWADAFDAGTVTTSEVASAALRLISTIADHTLPTAERRLAEAAGESGVELPDELAAWPELCAELVALEALLQVLEPGVFAEDLSGLCRDLAPAGKRTAGRVLAAMSNASYRRSRRALLVYWRGPIAASASLLTAAREAARLAAAWQQRTTARPRPCADSAGAAGALAQLEKEIGMLAGVLQRSDLAVGTVGSLRALLESLRTDTQTVAKLPELTELRRRLESYGLGPLLSELRERNLTVEQALLCLEGVWIASILERVMVADPQIGAFDGEAHRRVVTEYQIADRAHVESTSLRVRRAVAENITRARDEYRSESDLILHQSRLHQRHLPVRQLFHAAPHVLGAIKPCWAMSPLVVAQLLPPERCFDVVIFDEASQVPPADAIGALLRADQAIVAGDPHQLPPTSFFQTSGGGEDDEDAEVEGLLPDTKDMESILDAMSALLPAPKGTRTLGWHYRSKDERLIAFSNAQPSLYDWSLTTFPGVAGGECLYFELIPFRPGRIGEQDSVGDEVLRVVELIEEHAHQHPTESLGVIAMGLKHANRIDEVLRRARLENDELDAFLSGTASAQAMKEPFFVKNLERVQGDERDAIILTIGYGKTTDGRMLYRFGPINIAGGERRLNVAITRARAHMTVVSSFAAVDMDATRLRSEGPRMLARYLAYAESGGTDLGSVARDKPSLNPFERDVEARLTRAGIPVVAQFGYSGYWIDFAAQHPTRPGQMVLAIECDGASYHSSQTARDRDRLRQEHLERLGWRFHRIWSQDWFTNCEREIERTVAAYDAAVTATDAGKPAYGTPGPASAELDDPPDGETADPQPSSSTSTVRNGPCPVLGGRGSIAEYSESELVAVVRWIESDTLLRTEQELLTEVLHQLGFKKRGSNIVAAITAAIAAARNPRWKRVRITSRPLRVVHTQAGARTSVYRRPRRRRW